MTSAAESSTTRLSTLHYNIMSLKRALRIEILQKKSGTFPSSSNSDKLIHQIAYCGFDAKRASRTRNTWLPPTKCAHQAKFTCSSRCHHISSFVPPSANSLFLSLLSISCVLICAVRPSEGSLKFVDVLETSPKSADLLAPSPELSSNWSNRDAC